MTGFGYLAKEGFKNVWNNRIMSIASVCVLISCLVLTGAAALFSLNVDKVVESVGKSNETSVYIKDGYSQLEAVYVGKAIEKLDNVESATFLSKEDAIKQYKSTLGDDLFAEMKGRNKLPDSFIVVMKDLSKYDETIAQIKKIDGVDSFSSHRELAKKLTDISNLVNMICVAVVFAYYILATLLPVDKIIGKIYPLFAVALLFMAVGILVMLYVNHPVLPELWDGLQNTNPEASKLPIFQIMFVSIACGAISGFHATQSPLMARCMTSERHGRPVFYGAMITEGIVALIWAAAATYFFHKNGMEESNASVIVDAITKEWLGTIGGILAILGVDRKSTRLNSSHSH